MLKMLKLTSRTMKNEVFFRKFSTRRPVMPWNPLTVQKMGSASSASTIISQNLIPGMELSQEQAKDVALRLTSEEREILITALQECQSLKGRKSGTSFSFQSSFKFGSQNCFVFNVFHQIKSLCFIGGL